MANFRSLEAGLKRAAQRLAERPEQPSSSPAEAKQNTEGLLVLTPWNRRIRAVRINNEVLLREVHVALLLGSVLSLLVLPFILANGLQIFPAIERSTVWLILAFVCAAFIGVLYWEIVVSARRAMTGSMAYLSASPTLASHLMSVSHLDLLAGHELNANPQEKLILAGNDSLEHQLGAAAYVLGLLEREGNGRLQLESGFERQSLMLDQLTAGLFSSYGTIFMLLGGYLFLMPLIPLWIFALGPLCRRRARLIALCLHLEDSELEPDSAAALEKLLF